MLSEDYRVSIKHIQVDNQTLTNYPVLLRALHGKDVAISGGLTDSIMSSSTAMQEPPTVAFWAKRKLYLEGDALPEITASGILIDKETMSKHWEFIHLSMMPIEVSIDEPFFAVALNYIEVLDFTRNLFPFIRLYTEFFNYRKPMQFKIGTAKPLNLPLHVYFQNTGYLTKYKLIR